MVCQATPNNRSDLESRWIIVYRKWLPLAIVSEVCTARACAMARTMPGCAVSSLGFLLIANGINITCAVFPLASVCGVIRVAMLLGGA